jgi:CO/xanthine dehydrogenase Mo-binding subunit
VNLGARDVSSRHPKITPRVEDPRLVAGAGAYAADLITSDTLHCRFVRSPVAHGDIQSIDRDEAARMPGVIGVFIADDLGLGDIPAITGRSSGADHMTRPPLARGRVRHVGDTIAVVVAESPVAAADAADLVWVDIDERPALLDPELADGADIRLFDGGGNVVWESENVRGPEPTSPPAVSATVVVDSQRLAPTAIEPLGIVVDPTGDEIRIWCGHQAPHRLRNQIAGWLGLDPATVRVTVPDVGGAFGMKGMVFPEYVVVTELARRLGRRVAWIQERREQFVAGTHGRSQRHRITLEGEADGRLTRARIELLADTGAYPHNGAQVPMFSRLVATGIYDIPRVEVIAKVVVTNRAPTGSYRGAGRPEAALAIERAIDAFARAAGLDPVEVRLRNLVTELPYTSATNAIYDSGDYAAAIRRAVEMIDLPAVRAEQAARLRDGRDPIGFGMGSFVERAGGAVDSGEYAKVEVVDGEIVVRTGSVDTGQGHETAWAQVARMVFGELPVRVVAKDTGEVADGVGTFASRSTQIGASAVKRMAESVLEKARARAAERLEAAAVDLEYESGTFRVAGVPGVEVALFDLVDSGALEDEEMYVPGAQTFPYGAHAAVVEVVLETGEVRVLDLITVDDCGVVLNPMLVEGQLHGSVAQGLGQALLEEVRYDESGQPLTATFVDYLVPHAPDFSAPRTDHLVHPAPSNPLGAKGTGEAGCIGVPPAILNAALDALAPYGVEDLQLPLRPEKVWTAITEARVRNG